MSGLLPSILILGAALLLAVYLTGSRDLAGDKTSGKQIVQALLVATVLQTIHFLEESFTGFHQQFPALFALPAIPMSIFVLFNSSWIVIWFASAAGISRRVRIALLPAWFLAIAGTLNGVAHPAMALLVGNYFPGLFTGPVVGLACVWLWVKLLANTTAEKQPT